MRVKHIIGLLLVAVVALGGCAANGAQAPAPATTGATADLAFTGRTLDGTAYAGQQLAGKPTVLWFWAPWCPTCRAQAGVVSSLAQQYAGQVNVVGVGGLADASAITDFADGVQGPIHLVDVEGAIWRHFGVTAQSTYLVLDAKGTVVSNGYLDDDALSAQVARLVG